MSKRKNLSADEKRAKLLEIFHETSDVFLIKDLERIAPKEKGIVLQSVKITLEELVDSGRVHSEKIGGNICYWSFPNECLHNTKQMLQYSLNENKRQDSKIADLEGKLKEYEDTLDILDKPNISALEAEIEELKKEKADLQRRLDAAKNDIDYGEVEKKQEDTKKILEAANRWTDNIFTIKTWCKRKFDKEDRELNKAFGIPEDMDYLDD